MIVNSLNTTSPSADSGHERSFFTPERIARGMMVFLILGLAARAVRFGLCFPLWEDECFLCMNFIDRSFAELLQPLAYHQVAPPLFLWLERAMVLLLGYSEWSLRFIPFLASMASLFLFRRLIGHILDRPSQLFAFALFAVAYPTIRYAAEAKPYATDLFVALTLLVLAVEWYRSRHPGWLLALALCAAPALWLSYPAAFVAGGASLAIAVVLFLPLVRGRGTSGASERVLPSRGNVISWIALNLAILLGFGTLLPIIARQSQAELGFMASYWQEAFPPWSKPWELVIWLISAHTSELFAWPIGGARGASTFTTILFAIGLWQLVKRKDSFWTALLLGPLLLNLVAAVWERYPYGGHIKFSMYFGPALCLIAGWGAVAWNRATARWRPVLARRAAWVTVALLATVAAGSMARDVWHPYKTRSDERARAFAQWFWFNAEVEAAVRVVHQFHGEPFSPKTVPFSGRSELSWTAMFLCNRAIYAPDAPPPFPAGKEKPRLRCLVYRDPRFEFSEAARDDWLAEMRKSHELISRQTFPFTRYAKGEELFVTVDYLDLYVFGPRAGARTARAGSRHKRF